MSQQRHSGGFEVVWEKDLNGTVWYQMYLREPSGQLALLSTFDQGPFDTALDVAQWAWRVIAREVPPAST
jgi:hypothetical protein